MSRRPAAASNGRTLADTREALVRLEERLADLMERMIDQLAGIDKRLEQMGKVLADHTSRIEGLERSGTGRARAWHDFLTYGLALAALIFSGLRVLR